MKKSFSDSSSIRIGDGSIKPQSSHFKYLALLILDSVIFKFQENPIELDVTVTRVGEGPPLRLRRTEFLLTEGGEVSVTSMDLTL